MTLTNDLDLANRMRLLRSHGITSDAAAMHSRPPEEIWNYQQVCLGFNYRMTDIHAALGLSQLQRIDEFVAKRQDIADQYDKTLPHAKIVTPWQHEDSHSSFHLYLIRLKLSEINKTHRQVYDALHEVGIRVNLHYIPVYRQPYFEKFGFAKGYCKEAEKFYEDCMSIPMYPGLTQEQQEFVIDSIALLLGD